MKFTYPNYPDIPMAYHTTVLEIDMESQLNMTPRFLSGGFPFSCMFSKNACLCKKTTTLYLGVKPHTKKPILFIQNGPVK